MFPTRIRVFSPLQQTCTTQPDQQQTNKKPERNKLCSQHVAVHAGRKLGKMQLNKPARQKLERIPGSGQSMQSYILTYPKFWRISKTLGFQQRRPYFLLPPLLLLFLMISLMTFYNTTIKQHKQRGTIRSWDTTQYHRKVLNVALWHTVQVTYINFCVRSTPPRWIRGKGW